MSVSREKEIDDVTSAPAVHVAPSPHVFDFGMTTRTMMRDVLISLTPVTMAGLVFFRWGALKQLMISMIACVLAEALFARMRKQAHRLNDLSALVTGLILGLSMPATAPWYVGCIAAGVAIGIGKMVFGGLGMNIFNPAMVGRAFVMIAFAGNLAASGYVAGNGGVDILSQATPLTAYKQAGVVYPLSAMFWGNTNGSIGETSALACLLGGVWLCFRRVASWQIPAGILISTVAVAGGINLVNLGSPWTVVHHLLGGALLFGAFFIATDPVSSPLSAGGKWIYGAGIGCLVMLLRYLSGYPEGIMFAVLLMNAVTPLINRWTIPRPFGGA